MSKTMAAARGDSIGNNVPALYLAFELGLNEWMLGFSISMGTRARLRAIKGGDLDRLMTDIAQAKKKFGLQADAPVRSCYEAGRDGFWLHRWLGELGVENVIVDSASIESNRRARRRKTDRLDAAKLVTMLIRHHTMQRPLSPHHPRTWQLWRFGAQCISFHRARIAYSVKRNEMNEMNRRKVNK
jgi:hypothetical protein